MNRSLAWIALLLALPVAAGATTGEDLSARMVVDGDIGDYQNDERVLDATTVPPEPDDDSAWGRDNDIASVSLTWDASFLYVAVACVTLDSRLFLFLDHAPGGIADMRSLGTYRRAIGFGTSGFRPDVLVAAHPRSAHPEVLRVGAGAPAVLSSARGRFVQDGPAGGALEVAIPWTDIMPQAGVVSLCAVVTGETGTGGGDAAPDPNAQPVWPRGEHLSVDRALAVEVDSNGDGVPDAGVSPQAASTVPQDATRGGDTDVGVALDAKSFVPDNGESVTLTIFAPEAPGALFMSARVYSRSGELVRVLFRDELRDPRSPLDEAWDGTGESGAVVPGGIYVINVTWGGAAGARDGARNTAVAVVR